MSNKNVALILNVSLRPETLAALTAKVRDVNPSEILSARASQQLELIADGGVLLTPDQVTEIEKAADIKVDRAQDIVTAIQKKAGIVEGANVYQIKLDPTFVGPIEIRAKECGRSVQDLMNDMADIALQNNWIYGIDFDGTRRTFTPEQEAFFENFTGKKSFDVQDIIDASRKRKKVAAPESEPIPVTV